MRDAPLVCFLCSCVRLTLHLLSYVNYAFLARTIGNLPQGTRGYALTECGSARHVRDSHAWSCFPSDVGPVVTCVECLARGRAKKIS